VTYRSAILAACSRSASARDDRGTVEAFVAGAAGGCFAGNCCAFVDRHCRPASGLVAEVIVAPYRSAAIQDRPLRNAAEHRLAIPIKIFFILISRAV
jgi:hypothetical protein